MAELSAAIDDLGAAGGILGEPCQGLLSVALGPECQRLLLWSPFNGGEDRCEPDYVIANTLADIE
jgi:hypothetical protein